MSNPAQSFTDRDYPPVITPERPRFNAVIIPLVQLRAARRIKAVRLAAGAKR